MDRSQQITCTSVNPLPADRAVSKASDARPTSGGSLTLRALIVAPILCLTLFAIAAQGVYFGTLHNLDKLTAETAKATAAAASPAERWQIARRTVDKAISDYPLLRRDRLQLSVTENGRDSTRYDVTLTYDTPQLGVWPLAGSASSVRYSTTVRVGGV
ncbi:MAG: hypothetical protein KIT36_05130 [Alphaproteobacteria bacterium]|nr:hypothetical protein [Alphaproteobacteria bacterium]